MRIRTEVEEEVNNCRMINEYNADTSEYLGRKIYDAKNKVLMHTFSYNKAHKVLMKAAKRKRG